MKPIPSVCSDHSFRATWRLPHIRAVFLPRLTQPRRRAANRVIAPRLADSRMTSLETGVSKAAQWFGQPPRLELQEPAILAG